MKGQFFKNLDFAGYSLQSDNHKDEITNIGPQNTELKKLKIQRALQRWHKYNFHLLGPDIKWALHVNQIWMVGQSFFIFKLSFSLTMAHLMTFQPISGWITNQILPALEMVWN